MINLFSLAKDYRFCHKELFYIFVIDLYKISCLSPLTPLCTCKNWWSFLVVWLHMNRNLLFLQGCSCPKAVPCKYIICLWDWHHIKPRWRYLEDSLATSLNANSTGCKYLSHSSGWSYMTFVKRFLITPFSFSQDPFAAAW